MNARPGHGFRRRALELVLIGAVEILVRSGPLIEIAREIRYRCRPRR